MITFESWALGLLVTALIVTTFSSIILGIIVRRVSWENPGIIAKSFFPGPDRRHSRLAPVSATVAPSPVSAPEAISSANAGASVQSAKAAADIPVAPPSTLTRRKSIISQAAETHPIADWEIDPRKLKMKYTIGKGNFGEVWLASWLGSPVAVKTIVPELQTKEKLVKRFVDEIILMSTLHHPNVVLFLGACTRRPNLCLVLEFCVHGSLHHFLKSESSHGVRITMSLIYRFALDIARGVYYLHRRCSIVQRDLKARNILVDESLNAKVADFGLSRVIDEAENNKLTACGTPAWTAPEIVKMEAYTDKVDVYSFGIILWELITRQEPYGGQKGVQIAYAAAEQGLRPEIPPYCPPDYAELMRACWANKPDDRPPFATILKKLFQMKKACDAAGTGESDATAVFPRKNVGGDESDDDSCDSPVIHTQQGAVRRQGQPSYTTATATRTSSSQHPQSSPISLRGVQPSAIVHQPRAVPRQVSTPSTQVQPRVSLAVGAPAQLLRVDAPSLVSPASLQQVSDGATKAVNRDTSPTSQSSLSTGKSPPPTDVAIAVADVGTESVSSITASDNPAAIGPSGVSNRHVWDGSVDSDADDANVTPLRAGNEHHAAPLTVVMEASGEGSTSIAESVVTA